MLQVSMRTLATVADAVVLMMDRSQSLARRRHRSSHPNVRSTTHRRGMISKPLPGFDRLMISRAPLLCPLHAYVSLFPAWPTISVGLPYLQLLSGADILDVILERPGLGL